MIEVEQLSKVYVDVPVVDDLSFFVPEGQVLGFLGPNGAGKTTAMRMITGFLPPTTGRVVVGGIDQDQDPVGLRRNLGYLPENVPLYPEMRVDEYLRFRADIEDVPRAELAENLGYVLDRCFLGEVSHRMIGTLSKGYRQRVGLAGALIHRPSVLILDEPTVGLDPNQIIKIRELITELGADHTVVLCSHILPEVEQVCERVFIIDRGRIVADGSPDDLQSRLLGNPALKIEIKGGGDDVASHLAALEGAGTVTAAGDGIFRLEHDPASDLREAVFHLAVENGWILTGLAAEQASLEDVFVRLTMHDEAATREEV
jgi:ABC-2 type transport system ATP-binding protein